MRVRVPLAAPTMQDKKKGAAMMEAWETCANHYGAVRDSIITDCNNCPYKGENLPKCHEKRARQEYYEYQKEMTEFNAS